MRFFLILSSLNHYYNLCNQTLNANFKMTHLNTSKLSPQLTIRDRYLLAKELAFGLLAEISIFIAQRTCQQCTFKIAEINNLLESCQQDERGQVFLITCSSIIQLPGTKISHLLPKSYPACIDNYLATLIEDKKQQGDASNVVRDTYRGKLKKSSNLPEQRKRKILDWMFVERADRVLRAMAEEKKEQIINFKTFNAKVRTALSKSLNLAKTIFSEEQFLEYRDNIDLFLSVSCTLEASTERVAPNVGKFIIIDESLDTHKQKYITVRKNSATRINPSFKSSLKYRLQKSISINQSMESSRKNEGENEKKYLSNQRTSKRGSLSSNCSKRSSAYNNKSEEKGARMSTRWGNKINIQIVANSFNKNKPFRRSNFQQIKSKELEFYAKEESPFLKKISSIVEEDAQQDRQLEMTMNNLFIDGFLKSLRRMKNFYVFLQEEGMTYLSTVEELKQSELTHSEDRCEEMLRVRIKVNNHTKTVMLLMFSQLQLGSVSKETKCLKILRKHAQFYRNELRLIKAKTFEIQNQQENEDEDVHQNIFEIIAEKEGVLLGFIRKISTYFICICRYQKEDIQSYYEPNFRRRMLEVGRLLKTEISVQEQLKNTDLTMDFRVEPVRTIKRGSAIEYIQKQEDDNNEGFEMENDGYRTKIVQNTVKELGEVFYRMTWQSEHSRKNMERVKHRRQKKANSKMQKFIIERQFEGKRLKRIGANKNSIKMNTYLNDMEGSNNAEIDLFKTHQAHSYSKKEINPSEKRIVEKTIKTTVLEKQIKKKIPQKQKHFIQSIKTDKGYQLILHKQSREITGYKYETYFGYKQRNPRRCCYYKESDELRIDQDNFYKTGMSIHGNKERIIECTPLITFTKLIYTDEGFGGYVVSSIKILPNSINSDIFIEVYWQAKQKYFIFLVSSDVFEKLTDINTRCFEEKPFLMSTEIQQQVSKKRGQRTSVVASLMRERQAQLLKQSNSNKFKRFCQQHEESFREISQLSSSYSKDREQTKRKYENRIATNHQMQTMARVIKTVDTCSTSKNMKSSLRSQTAALKREVVVRLKNKVVKYATFVWRNYKMYLQLKYTVPTQLDSVNIVEFQGSELALKNVYPKAKKSTELVANNSNELQATELILVKYSENSLANLNFYSMQGTSKIYLEHVFIKNSSQLYGRYTSSINVRQLIESQRVFINYRDNNTFFEPKSARKPSFRNNHLMSKSSTAEDQRKLKYQDILALAKSCSISIDVINQKKKKIKSKRLIIPNRYKYFESEDPLLQVEIREEEIVIKNLANCVLETINIEKLEKFLLFVSKWPLRTFTKLITTRILKDEDLLNLCIDRNA